MEHLELVERVEDLLRAFPQWSAVEEDFSTPGLWGVYHDKLPALALGFRLALDPQVTQVVADLAALPEDRRLEQVRELTGWLPRGSGRRVVGELLLRAAKGGRIAFTGAATMVWFPEGETGPADPQRRPKGVAARGVEAHDWFRSCAEMADLAVRRLLGDPSAVRPAPTPKEERAQQQRLRAFLQEAAAHVLKLGEHDGDGEKPIPVSRARLRRAA